MPDPLPSPPQPNGAPPSPPPSAGDNPGASENARFQTAGRSLCRHPDSRQVPQGRQARHRGAGQQLQRAGDPLEHQDREAEGRARLRAGGRPPQGRRRIPAAEDRRRRSQGARGQPDGRVVARRGLCGRAAAGALRWRVVNRYVESLQPPPPDEAQLQLELGDAWQSRIAAVNTWATKTAKNDEEMEALKRIATDAAGIKVMERLAGIGTLPGADSAGHPAAGADARAAARHAGGRPLLGSGAPRCRVREAG